MAEMVNLGELLDFAIKREETSAAFFSSVANRTGDSTLEDIFRTLVKKCLDRKRSLTRLRGLEGHSASNESIPVESFREYLVDVEPRPELSDLQALALGGVRAETSEKLYARISLLVSEPRIKEIFEQLRGDHRIHRQLCNCLYDQRLEKEL
jgi:rubrerythrin